MPLEAPDAGGRGAEGAATCERLLARHGVITHVAVLPEETPAPEVSRFRRDAAQVARNLLPLGPTEWGVHLDPAVPIPTGVAHALRRPSGLDATDPDRFGPLPPTPPQGESPDATLAESSAGARTCGHPERAADGDERGPADQASAPPLQGDRLSAQVEAISAQLSDLAPAVLADRIAEALAPALADRLEKTLRTTGQIEARQTPDFASPPSEAVDPLPEERIDAFWTGLEAALRLLDTTAREIHGAAAGLSEQRIGAALEEVETAVSLGFEAAGEARESFQSRTDARLSRLEALLTHTLPRLDSKLDAVSGGRERLADQGDDPESVAPPPQRGGAGGGDQVGQQVARQLDALTHRLEARGGLLAESIDATHRSTKNFWRATEDAVARLDTALDRLARVAAPEADAVATRDQAPNSRGDA